MTRTETIGGKSYFLEEWMLVQVAETGSLTVLGASSGAQAPADGYGSALMEAGGLEPGKRLLIIESAQHAGQLTEPLVKLRSLEAGSELAKHLPDGPVTLRASFSPEGVLEEVQVIEGNSRAARRLAKDLMVEFPKDHGDDVIEHEEHRSIVFATFEVVKGAAKFISAIPVLPQCCCPDWPHCPV